MTIAPMSLSNLKKQQNSHHLRVVDTLGHVGSSDSSVAQSSDAGDIAIAASNIEMVYSTGNQSVRVLKGIDLNVKEGDIQLLMGPSGSGKTTLLSVLGGILKPTTGDVTLLGQNITRLSKSKLSQFRLDEIGFIFQGFNLFDALSAAENIEVALKMKGVRRRAAHVQARELLERVGLGDRMNQLPRDLSGGQKQRVAIARALAGNPKIIMADEPTAALDSHSGQVVIELLRELAKEGGRTVLMVTHDPRIQKVADRVIYLEDGELKPIPDWAVHAEDIQLSA
ncbi:MAG: ABC transporter ATP-binding protein [Leptolyngbyaceae bacterium]|nr:ABC transporter ATP-binding protein [Leptolyngbyaceae bacterium]